MRAMRISSEFSGEFENAPNSPKESRVMSPLVKNQIEKKWVKLSKDEWTYL